MKSTLLPQFALLIVASLLVAIPTTALAQGGIVPCGGSGQAACQLRDLFVLLHNILQFAIFQLAPILVTVMVAIGGFKMLISTGNPGKYGEGVSLIKNALIGYAIVLVSMLLVNTILQQIGVAQWTGLLDWEIINF